ncbi:MAG: hypothetical protein WBI44_02570 [Syntrophaceticus sp.]
MRETHIQEKPKIKIVFVGGDGLETAFRMLARKILEERKGEEKQSCVLPSTLE